MFAAISIWWRSVLDALLACLLDCVSPLPGPAYDIIAVPHARKRENSGFIFRTLFTAGIMNTIRLKNPARGWEINVSISSRLFKLFTLYNNMSKVAKTIVRLNAMKYCKTRVRAFRLLWYCKLCDSSTVKVVKLLRREGVDVLDGWKLCDAFLRSCFLNVEYIPHMMVQFRVHINKTGQANRKTRSLSAFLPRMHSTFSSPVQWSGKSWGQQ